MTNLTNNRQPKNSNMRILDQSARNSISQQQQVIVATTVATPPMNYTDFQGLVSHPPQQKR